MLRILVVLAAAIFLTQVPAHAAKVTVLAMNRFCGNLSDLETMLNALQSSDLAARDKLLNSRSCYMSGQDLEVLLMESSPGKYAEVRFEGSTRNMWVHKRSIKR